MLIYVVTDRRRRPDLSPEELVDAAVRSGADMIQIREKDLPARPLLDLAIRAVAAGGADVYVNGRPDVALTAGARGVHLPADAVPADAVKRAWPGRLRVGVSTHSLEEARAAEAAGADFITFGPVFDTASKRAYGPPVGLAALGEVVASTGIPVFAIGGIDAARVPDLARLRVAGIAVVGAVISAPDMSEAVARIRAATA